MSRFPHHVVALSAALVLLGHVPAHAGTLSWEGDTTAAATFQRPDGPDILSGWATAVPYQAYKFRVDRDGLYAFHSVAEDWDNFALLYRGRFDPKDALRNLVTGNDDLYGVIGTTGFPVGLTGGAKYILVTTGFDNAEFGRYGNAITGAGVITAVPEPATALTALLGGLAIAGWRLRGRSLAG